VHWAQVILPPANVSMIGFDFTKEQALDHT
jgi:hypothetical protein